MYLSNWVTSNFCAIIQFKKYRLSLEYFRNMFLWRWKKQSDFSPMMYYIWNKQDILYKNKNKSLNFDYWFENNIIVVSQLLNNDGVLLTYKEY